MQNINEQRLLDFIQSALSEPNSYRDQIIKSLKDKLNYDKCIFWLADAKGHLYDPISSFDEDFLKDYQTSHLGDDYLHPQNIGIDYALDHMVINLCQAVEQNQLLASSYYDFLQLHEIDDVINIYLKYDNQLIGLIAIFHTKLTDAVNNEELESLKAITPILSSRLNEMMLFDYTHNMKSIFESFINKSAAGCIVFGTSFTVYYCNSEALRICELFKDSEKNNSCVDFFINNVLANNSYAWISGMEKTLLLPSFEQVTIKIIPVANNKINSKEKHIFMVIFELNNDAQKNEIEEDEKANTLKDYSFRELEVINLVINGYSNQEIANELYISINTVKKHLSQIFCKTQVANRTSLIHKISQAKTNNNLFNIKKPLA